MDEATKHITDGLFRAIQAEGDGEHFYRMAAGSVADPKGKEVFEMLAREELDHQRFLKAQYKSFAEAGRPDASVKLGQKADLSGESPIFSSGLRARVHEAHFEMSALSIGIQLELNAMKFYQDQADAASDQAVRSFFTELAEWESGHYHALLRQQEALKEDYWSAADFSPY